MFAAPIGSVPLTTKENKTNLTGNTGSAQPNPWAGPHRVCISFARLEEAILGHIDRRGWEMLQLIEAEEKKNLLATIQSSWRQGRLTRFGTPDFMKRKIHLRREPPNLVLEAQTPDDPTLPKPPGKFGSHRKDSEVCSVCRNRLVDCTCPPRFSPK